LLIPAGTVSVPELNCKFRPTEIPMHIYKEKSVDYMSVKIGCTTLSRKHCDRKHISVNSSPNPTAL